MPDLLSHAFIAYTLCIFLGIRFPWITPQYVTVGMAGAFIPDVSKADFILGNELIGNALGLPFDWFGVHTLGGATVAALVGVTLTANEHRRRAAALLAVGASSHLLADALLFKTSGHSYPVLWPLTAYYPPTPGLYLSTDVWPSVVTGGVALGTWLLVRRFRGDQEID